MAYVMIVIYIAIVAALIVGGWKTFEKMGLPGWASIVPIYNLYLLWQVSGREMLWFILCFVPCVNIVAIILICIDVAKAFGKGAGIGVLLVVTGIGWLILGFGDATYQGKKIQTGMPSAPPPQ